MSEARTYTTYQEVPKFIYAGFFIRLVAFAIDMMVASAISNVINNIIGNDASLVGSLTVDVLIRWIVILLYFTLMTYFTNGQTLGKMITNIKVISQDGNRLSLWQVVSRETFGRYIQNKINVLYLIPAFAPKKQSLADMLCDTVVIRIDQYDYVNDCEGNLL